MPAFVQSEYCISAGWRQHEFDAYGFVRPLAVVRQSFIHPKERVTHGHSSQRKGMKYARPGPRRLMNKEKHMSERPQRNLSLELVRATEAAALVAARYRDL